MVTVTDNPPTVVASSVHKSQDYSYLYVQITLFATNYSYMVVWKRCRMHSPHFSVVGLLLSFRQYSIAPHAVLSDRAEFSYFAVQSIGSFEANAKIFVRL